MKKQLLVVPKYFGFVTLITLFFTALFIMFPMNVSGTLPMHLGVFVYISLSLFPLIAIFGLLIHLLSQIQKNYFSFFDFLIYSFLYLLVWLIIIPIFIFLEPAQQASILVTHQASSITKNFFTPEFILLAIKNLEEYKISIPPLITNLFSNIYYLCTIAISTAYEGRIHYTLFATIALALASIYSFRNISKWKLINVILCIFFWCFILWANIVLYKQDWGLSFVNQWGAVVCNLIFAFCMGIVELVKTIKRKRMVHNAI